MGKFDGVLLASDYDNTLVYTQDALLAGGDVPPLSAENQSALEYFMAQGGKFAIATGRALPAFETIAPGIPMNAPCIVCNGAAIYDFSNNAYIKTALLPPESLERCQEILDKFPKVGVEAYHLDNVIHAVQVNDAVRSHVHLTKVSVAEQPSMKEVPLPLGKLLFEGDEASLTDVEMYAQKQPWYGEYELIRSGKTLLELTARGASKGGMLRELADLLGISMEQTYAVGDERNDLSMLAAAKVGFAPVNCAVEVRRSGAVMVGDARGGAVAEVVEWLGGRSW
jgi:Cof subfamily protein (haloacid dehalogenase superfamily)